MIGKYRHISFDLDGTLVHTVPKYRHTIVPQVVGKLGGEVREKHSIDRFWFESGRDQIIKNDFNLEPADFWQVFRSTDSPELRLSYIRVYEDSERVLKKLKEIGKVVSIVTGAPHWIAKMEIEKLNGAPYDIHFSITDSKFNEKPAPESLINVLEKLSVGPSETLYIGNSDEDVYYAQNAGVDFVRIERGEHEFDFKDNTVQTIFSLDELLNVKYASRSTF